MVSECDSLAGCIQTKKVCVVDDVNCFVGSCSSSTGECSKTKRSNFNTATSSNGESCLLRYDKRTVAAIGAGTAAGISVAAAAGLAAVGFGGKKGYELYRNHFAVKDSAITDNPLYSPSEGTSDNPLFEPNSN